MVSTRTNNALIRRGSPVCERLVPRHEARVLLNIPEGFLVLHDCEVLESRDAKALWQKNRIHVDVGVRFLQRDNVPWPSTSVSTLLSTMQRGPGFQHRNDRRACSWSRFAGEYIKLTVCWSSICWSSLNESMALADCARPGWHERSSTPSLCTSRNVFTIIAPLVNGAGRNVSMGLWRIFHRSRRVAVGCRWWYGVGSVCGMSVVDQAAGQRVQAVLMYLASS